MIEQALTPTKIIRTSRLSAADADKLLSYCGGQRTCFIVDNKPLPPRDTMLDELAKIRDIIVLNRVFPDPKAKHIMTMVNGLMQEKIDLVVGIGGGSALDSAKAVAAILSNGGDLNDYLGPKATRKIEKCDPKLILIPTTAGTGSEVTKVGVYTSHKGRKYTLGHPAMQADIAVLNTEYVLGLPPAITAYTAFDALSHALETIWNRNATPLTDRIAVESAIHILKWMETAYDSSLTGEAAGRAEMLEGACMAGVAFNMTGTAAIHALSFILSEEWHVPHGVACAFMMEDVFWLSLNDQRTNQLLTQIAEALFGKDDDETLIEKLYNRIIALKQKFGLPFYFYDLGIEVNLSKLWKLFKRAFKDPKMMNSVFPFDKEDIYEMIQSKNDS